MKQQTSKEIWQEFYSGFTMHGFHFIIDRNGLRRVIWILLLCFSFALSVYLFQGVIRDYLDYKTVTSTEVDFTVKEVDFPTVTICNMNSVSEKKMNSVHRNNSEIARFYQNLRERKLDLNDSATKNFLEYFKTDFNISTEEDFINYFELSIEDMMNDSVTKAVRSSPCEFKSEKCSSTDFKGIMSNKYGLCHQFNSFDLQKNRINVKYSGVGNGLHLYLNVHHDKVAVSSVPYTGLVLFIHPLGTSFDWSRSKWILVQPGSMNFVHVKMSQIELLPAPYKSACVKDYDYKHMNNTNKYLKSECEYDCMVDAMMTKCGCLSPAYTQLDTIHVYKNSSSKSRHHGVRCTLKDFHCESQFRNMSHLVERNCEAKCPLGCNFTKYQLTSQSVVLGTKHTFTDIMNLKDWNASEDETQEFVRKNIIGLDISFSEISISREILSPSVTWAGLLGSIGGNLGLCLGASVLTFCELIMFLFEICWSCTIAKRRKEEGNAATERKA